ncbi:DUF5329 domain-containing protein [Pseudoalteromonas shioyasakiensis]|uniref:DUF5329 family protein n=1 Tax=Pseudoalteromonas shioyasakiensis TaxID=1190813 RepID=UPI002118F4D4|nr:DUF5329 domain-containing protein [Pseudoalteromonas shioyasakiensis]MCQ8883716.1 DUF5329 domain-containing protein [Pseudoalteromonas shioyasakiensis]
MKRYWFIALMFLRISQFCIAATPEQEINHLIDFVAKSDAVFIRNDTEHSSQDAAEHLAMKYRKATRYANTADKFIENLASKSSWSGKPYKVRLSNGSLLNAKDWLSNELEEYRRNQHIHN